MAVQPLPTPKWAVTDAAGVPVRSLDALAGVLGLQRKAAASALLASPYADVAPPRLVAEAKAAKGPAKAPPIASGSFVSWGDKRGRVDLVVTNGKVPGITGDDVEGTPASPAARVVVYEKAGAGWKATSEKVGAKTATLKRVPPMPGTRQGKARPDAELVRMLTEHEGRAAELGVQAVPQGKALLDVYDRGVKAWPGAGRTELDAQGWGLARVGAFLTKALGTDVPGYTRDDDLLPAPAAAPQVKVAAGAVMTREQLLADLARLAD